VRLAEIPTGLRLTAQGCCTQLPWDLTRNGAQPQRGCVVQPKVAVLGYVGTSRDREHNPKGVVAVTSKCKTQRGRRRASTLSGLERLSPSYPKVAEYSNLGLVVATLSGLQCSTILGSRRQWRGNRNTVAYQSHT